MTPRPNRPSDPATGDAASVVSIIGAGGHGRVIAGLLRAAGTTIAGFWDDDPAKWGTLIGGSRVQGPIEELSSHDGRAIIAIGDNRIRRRIAMELDLEWTIAVHPAAWVDPDVQIGAGTAVCAGAIVQPGAHIGMHVIVNSRAGVDHDSRLSDYSHISAAHLGAGSIAHEGAFIGIGGVVLPFKEVGSWAIVGAGAVVTRDVPDGHTVVGNPAHSIAPREATRQ